MYKTYIKSLIDINREQRGKFIISEDIIEFLKNLKIETIDFKGILQLYEKDNDLLYTICSKIFGIIFENNDYKLIKENKENENKNDIVLTNNQNNNRDSDSENSVNSDSKNNSEENKSDSNNDIKNNLNIKDKDLDLDNLLIEFKQNLDILLNKNFKKNYYYDNNSYNDFLKDKSNKYKRVSMDFKNDVFQNIYGVKDLDLDLDLLNKEIEKKTNIKNKKNRKKQKSKDKSSSKDKNKNSDYKYILQN